MKIREQAILSRGMGPLRKMPDEEREKRKSTFVDEYGNPNKLEPIDGFSFNKPEDTIADVTFQPEKIKRGEQGYREREFEYDINSDPLFQQYLASAKRNGEKAMTDTIAKAAAQTGGVAGSYAVAAGAQSYNDYMQSVNDVIPQLEQLAYQRYNDELDRDLKIMEMDEEQRWEDANVSSIVQDYQNYGAPLTAEQRTAWVASGGYIDGDVLVDAMGNRYERGTKYNKEREQEAYNKYESDGWDNLTAEEQRILQDAGYVFDRNENMISKDGKSFAWNDVEGKAKTNAVNTILNKFQNGGEITGNELYTLQSNGYSYDEASGIITNVTTGEKFGINPELKEQQFNNAYAAYYQVGWGNLSDEERRILRDNGYVYDSETDMIGIQENGKFTAEYYWSGTVDEESALDSYHTNGWNGMSEKEKNALKNAGFTYDSEKNGIYKTNDNGEKEYVYQNGRSDVDYAKWSYLLGYDLTTDQAMLLQDESYTFGTDGYMYDSEGNKVYKVIDPKAEAEKEKADERAWQEHLLESGEDDEVEYLPLGTLKNLIASGAVDESDPEIGIALSYYGYINRGNGWWKGEEPLFSSQIEGGSPDPAPTPNPTSNPQGGTTTPQTDPQGLDDSEVKAYVGWFLDFKNEATSVFTGSMPGASLEEIAEAYVATLDISEADKERVYDAIKTAYGF